ncbi:acyl-CoA synthetase [Agaricicola taiwanensis]|uniref:Acyl-CoA synthetase n=1 Tax=Agaricicola taiwanensis TaxID=591372 RepID=A0A8J3DW11_9RHOB|nr:AMP-binding protein [Agaricicola taiwanensis]GGE48625.1 acyl-CoA synthetase [Agaricicola taiwanensis]
MIQIDDKLYDRVHFDNAALRLAGEVGLTTGTRYAVCFPETADWLAFFFAIRAAGASVMPIHPATPYPAARRLAETAGCHRLFYHSLAAEQLNDAPPVKGEGELLQMSSGTTGAPKCVARTWSSIDREIDTYVATFREPSDMTPVVACPTTHSYGLICGLLVALKRGQVPVVVNTANPKFVLKALRGVERPLLYSSPAILHTLARLLPSGESLHAVMTSGTLLPSAWFGEIRAKTRHMFQQYGCSEAGCIAINPDVSAPEDMGYVLPHHRLQAGSNAETADEIIIHTPSAPIHTRDLGYVRPDGMLVFISRLDDTINVSGLNVYPKDVEDVVMAKPGVSDAVAFRLADRFAGERVGLLFSADRQISAEEIRAWCTGNLASHQVPMEVIQVGTVPRQANGKISRREIAGLHAEGRLAPEPVA